MTSEREKDELIARLRAEIDVLEDQVGELKVQVRAINAFLMDGDPTNPDGGSRMQRIMQVVRVYETGNVASKWLIRVVLTLGALATAFAAIRGFTR